MKAFTIVKLLDVSKKNFPARIIAIKTRCYSLEVRPSTDRNPFTESWDIAGVFMMMVRVLLQRPLRYALGDRKRYFTPKRKVFLTIPKCFLFPSLNKIEKLNLDKCKEET